MRTRSVIGVAAGGLVDIVTTNVLSFPLLVYVALTHDLAQVPPAEAGPRMLAALQESSGLQVTAWLLGLIATVLGGYVAARIARDAELWHGALSAWLCMGLGVYALVTGAGEAPLWQHALAFVLSPLFGAVGGALRRRQASGGAGPDLRSELAAS